MERFGGFGEPNPHNGDRDSFVVFKADHRRAADTDE